MEAAENRFGSNDTTRRQAVPFGGLRSELLDGLWYAGSEMLVRTCVVIMPSPLSQDAPQMSLANRDQEVQALPSYCAHQALANGIGLGCQLQRIPTVPTVPLRSSIPFGQNIRKPLKLYVCNDGCSA